MTHLLLGWTPLLLWVALAFGLSSQGSPPGAEIVGSQAGGYGATLFHFVEYFVGGLLVYAALSYASPLAHLSIRYVASLILSVAIASVDETIQAFVPGRTASFFDVGTDALGATSALAFAAVASWLYGKLRRGRLPTDG